MHVLCLDCLSWNGHSYRVPGYVFQKRETVRFKLVWSLAVYGGGTPGLKKVIPTLAKLTFDNKVGFFPVCIVYIHYLVLYRMTIPLFSRNSKK